MKEKPKTAEFFVPRPERPVGWYGRCRDCRNAVSYSWFQTNGDEIRARARQRSRERFVSKRRTIKQRVLQKVEIAASGCWLWTGKINTSGYGVIWSGGPASEGRELRAHRVSYEEHVGPIPDGLDLDHLCRVRHCVNPDHLEPVTRRENLRRGVSEHSGGKTHCKRGHEFTPENTRFTADGYRQCRKCQALHQREYRARRNLAA